MVGGIAMQAALLLPPGEAKVIDRLRAQRTFRAGEHEVHRCGGAAEVCGFEPAGAGQETRREDGPDHRRHARPLRDERRRDQVHAADVLPARGGDRAGGACYGLRSETLDFTGRVALDAPISAAAGGGVKGFFLKAVDPIFRKDGKGAVIPITITGPREQPKFGVEWGKVFK